MNPPFALPLELTMLSPSMEAKREVLNSLPSGALAMLVMHGFFTQGLAISPSSGCPPFNLGRAIAEFKGLLCTGTLNKALSHWFQWIKDAFKLWKVLKNEQVGFASTFLGGLAKEWFFQEDFCCHPELLMRATGDKEIDEEDQPGF